MPKPIIQPCGGEGQPPCPPDNASEPQKKPKPDHPPGDDGPITNEQIEEWKKEQGL